MSLIFSRKTGFDMSQAQRAATATLSSSSPAERLLNACRGDSVASVRRLLVNHPELMSHQESEAGTLMSPLALAVEHGGSIELVELLLDSGAEEFGISRDVDGNTIMHIASRAGRPDLLELYHCFYADVIDWQNARGLTPLHLASRTGDETVVKFLLDLGADIDLPDLQGDTPLHYASSYGHKTIIRLLIERGATFQTKNERGWLAADYAYSIPVLNFYNDAVRQVFEENKRERLRRSTAKQAARSQTGVDRGKSADVMEARQQSTSNGSKRDGIIIAGPSSGFLSLPPPISDLASTIKHKESTSTLPGSASSLLTYGTSGTSGVSSGGPATPPSQSQPVLPPSLVQSPPSAATKYLGNSPSKDRPEPVRSRSTSGGSSSQSPARPDAKRHGSAEEGKSIVRDRHGNVEGGTSPSHSRPPFQLSKSAILSAVAAGRR